MQLRLTTLLFTFLTHASHGQLSSVPAVAAVSFAPAELEELPSAADADREEEQEPEAAQPPGPPDVWEDRLERFVSRALNLTRGHGGECAIGTGCGAAAGWLLRRIQGAVVTAAVLGSIGAAGAVHLGWMTVEQLQAVIGSVASFVGSQARVQAKRADLDGDGELTIEDSRRRRRRRRSPALGSALRCERVGQCPPASRPQLTMGWWLVAAPSAL